MSKFPIRLTVALLLIRKAVDTEIKLQRTTEIVLQEMEGNKIKMEQFAVRMNLIDKSIHRLEERLYEFQIRKNDNPLYDRGDPY